MNEQYFLVIDLEMCMVTGKKKTASGGLQHEVIQIGAVMLDAEDQIVDKFETYVKPQLGKIDPFIERLTGITQEMVEQAPVFQEAVRLFSVWLGQRKVVVLSWSDADYRQIKEEMREKRVKNRKIKALFETWIDFQRSFGRMLAATHRFGLDEALRIAEIKAEGQAHDGFADAYNTARLLAQTKKQQLFSLEFEPIVSYINVKEELAEEPEVVVVVKKSIKRRIFELFHRGKLSPDEAWNRYLFSREMRKLKDTHNF